MDLHMVISIGNYFTRRAYPIPCKDALPRKFHNLNHKYPNSFQTNKQNIRIPKNE